MSLTKGSGPFGDHPAGSFNFDPNPPKHVLYLESTPRRVRVVLAGATVADSTRVQLLHPPGRTPTYLFPSEHVRTELFEPSQRRRVDPGMGAGTYWNVRVGDRHAVDGAYSWEQPPDSATGIAGLIAFAWDAMDAVFEEDEQVFVHPRDPYTRIDVLRSSRRVRVRAGDTVVAESTRPRCTRSVYSLSSAIWVIRHIKPVPAVQGEGHGLVGAVERQLPAGQVEPLGLQPHVGRLVPGRPPVQTIPWRSSSLESRCRARIRSPRTSSRARTRPRAASWVGEGTTTSTISSSFNSRARCAASRASVFTRSPAGRCSFDGAATTHPTPWSRRNRANPNPVGPAL